jgi:hypothetical protein
MSNRPDSPIASAIHPHRCSKSHVVARQAIPTSSHGIDAMKRIFAAALAAFFMSAGIAKADDECWLRESAVASLEVEAMHAGGAVKTFPHDQTKAFLDVVNHTGDPTDFKADSIIIVILPSTKNGFVYTVNGGCVDKSPIILGGDLLLDAYKAAIAIDI